MMTPSDASTQVAVRTPPSRVTADARVWRRAALAAAIAAGEREVQAIALACIDAGSDRGDFFMGTDFTNHDVMHETDLSASDYHWRLDGAETVDSSECLILEGKPVDAATAKELGYSRVRMWVAAEHWIPLRGEYWGLGGRPLKTIRISEIRQVDGVWTPHRIEAERQDDGHRTVLHISGVDYEAELDDLLFSKRSLDSIPGRLR